MSPELVAASADAKAQALRTALRAGLLGLGGGVGLTAALHLPQLFGPKPIPSYPLRTDVDLLYPQEVKKKKEDKDEKKAAEEKSVASRVRKRVSELNPHDTAVNVASAIGTVPASLLGAGVGKLLSKRVPGLGWKPPKMPVGFGRKVSIKPLGGETVVPSLLGSATGAASYPLVRPLAEKAVDSMTDLGPSAKQADWASSAASMMSPTPGSPMPTIGSPSWLRGDSQTAPRSVPWAIPAAAAATVGGLYGGHQLVRYALRRKRKADLDSQLEAAQKEYDEAMLSQYDPNKLRDLAAPKEASAPVNALDFCFDRLVQNAAEKRSFDVDSLLGQGTGMYGVGAGLLGLASALGSYRWLKGRSGNKLLRDALKRRAMQRGLQNPPELYVRPVPVEYEGKIDEASPTEPSVK
jgi:hypothetical protein